MNLTNSDKKEWNTGLKKGWLVHRSGEVNHSKLICNLFWFLAVRISKKLKSAYKHEKIGQISCQGTFAIAIRSPVQPDQYLQVENWGVKWRTGKVWETFTQRNFPKTKIDFSEIDIESNDFHSNIECDTVSISKYKESRLSDFSKSFWNARLISCKSSLETRTLPSSIDSRKSTGCGRIFRHQFVNLVPLRERQVR